MRCPSPIYEAGERGTFLLPQAFVLFRLLKDCVMTTLIAVNNLLYLSPSGRCPSHLEIPLKTHSEITFNLDTLWPVKLIYMENYPSDHIIFRRNVAIVFVVVVTAAFIVMCYL